MTQTPPAWSSDEGLDSPRHEWLVGSWRAVLLCFLVAGLTGALFRVSMLTGLPADLQLADVRPAHSHLMYFGWRTPLLIALITRRLPSDATSRAMRRVVVLTVVAAALAYPPFLLCGYDPTTVAGVAVPPSTVAAGLNGSA